MPFRINLILVVFSLLFLAFKLCLLLLNLACPLFATEALVCASSYSEANATIGINLMSDDDLSRAVAPFISRGGRPPVTLPEQRCLTIEEEGHLALVLDLQNKIGTLLRSIDVSSFRSHHFEEESTSDLAAATLLHKEEDLHNHAKLWEVHEGLYRYGDSSIGLTSAYSRREAYFIRFGFS